MSESGAPEAEDQAYFRAVEEIFIGLRGSPLLLSPADWQVARGWRRRGIPLAIVKDVLEGLFRRREEAGGKGKIRSLRYCAAAVEEAWEEVEALGATGERAQPLPLDVDSRLRALAGALPAGTPGRASLIDAILACSGEAFEVEEKLSELDRKMMEAAEETIEEDERTRLEEGAAAVLASLAGRLSEEEIELSRARLRRQILRRRRGLPVLSLFSSEAGG